FLTAALNAGRLGLNVYTEEEWAMTNIVRALWIAMLVLGIFLKKLGDDWLALVANWLVALVG
ncbi:unnamed protein product, partial [marine sediment metagenome]